MLAFIELPEELQAVARYYYDQWLLQAFNISISVVDQQELDDFIESDGGGYGGCSTEIEYNRVTIKLSKEMELPRMTQCLKHELRHIHYASIDHAISSWVAMHRDALSPLAIKSLIRTVDVAVNQAIERDIKESAV